MCRVQCTQVPVWAHVYVSAHACVCPCVHVYSALVPAVHTDACAYVHGHGPLTGCPGTPSHPLPAGPSTARSRLGRAGVEPRPQGSPCSEGAQGACLPPAHPLPLPKCDTKETHCSEVTQQPLATPRRGRPLGLSEGPRGKCWDSVSPFVLEQVQGRGKGRGGERGRGAEGKEKEQTKGDPGGEQTGARMCGPSLWGAGGQQGGGRCSHPL